MDDAQQTFAYERYLVQRARPDGVVRDDLPYSPNLDLIVEAVNRRFDAAFSHGEVYQAISHMARKPDLRKRGLWRESDVPLHGGHTPAGLVSKVAGRKRARHPVAAHVHQRPQLVSKVAGQKKAQRQPGTRMRALSVRQPFAEQILAGDKQIEYRSIRTLIRGLVYIYASKTPADADSYEEAGYEVEDLPRGVLVGTVELVDCTGEDGVFEWHLANPRRLRTPLAVVLKPQPVFFWPFGR